MTKKMTAQDMLFKRLDEMHADIKQVRESDIPNMREQIAELKVRSSIWGAVSGVIGGGLIALTSFIHRN
jgi:hypothetical protein